MKKITFLMVAITILLSFGMAIFQSPLVAKTESDEDELRDKYLNIMTVTKPQADMVRKIVKDKHNVQYMTRDENEIREYTWSKDTLNNISSMDLFIYGGTDFESWTGRFIYELKKGNLGIINISRGIRFLNDNENNVNPFYFEGINEYKIALYNIKDAIENKDPKNRDYYEQNYNKAIDEFNKKIESRKNNLEDIIFITFDNRFDYILESLNANYANLENEYIDVYIEKNKLDPKKVVIVQDGEELKDLDYWTLDPHYELDDYNIIELWKYYGDMSYDELILYNIDQFNKIEKKINIEKTK